MLRKSKMQRSLSVLAAIAVSVTTILSSAIQNPLTVQASAPPTPILYEKDNGQLRNVMYYGDWTTGATHGYFNPDKIPADKLTHLNFAFLDFDKKGNLLWCEKEASVDDVVGIEGALQGAANAGILSGLIDLRAKNPNLRVGVSLGGWAKSGDFSAVAANPVTRKKLADNLASFVKYAQMDFVDIDWEYPGNYREPEYMDNQTNEGTPESNPDDMENYVLLLQDIRASLDELSNDVYTYDYTDGNPARAKKYKYYELSVAISANENVLEQGTDIEEVFAVCDFVNVMTYDTTGQWESKTGHHSALKTNPELGNRSIEQTVAYLLANGAAAYKNKIVIGCAFYSRGWEDVKWRNVEEKLQYIPSWDQNAINNATDDIKIAGSPGLGWMAIPVTPGTNGYAGNSNGTNGRGADNFHPATWGDTGVAAGIWPYYTHDDLKARYPGLVEYYDEAAEAPYLYNGSETQSGAFFTFDNERSITAKAEYVKANNLGGMIAWMQSNDAETVAGSNVRDRLTTAMKEGLFGTDPLQTYVLYPEGPDFGITYVYNKTKGTIDFTLRNKSGLSEKNEVLKEVEESYKTIFTPTLYIQVKPGTTLTAGENCGSVEMRDNVAIVYLYEVADMIHPKENLTFSLKPSAPNSYGVNSIVVTQRIVPTASEFYHKVLTISDWEASTMFALPTPKAIAAPTLDTTSKTLKVGFTQTLGINNPVKGSAYTWNSTNTKVATVSPQGVVTAVGPGTANITCAIKTTNNTYNLQAAITVSPDPVLSAASGSLKIGKTLALSVKNQISGSTYTWSSSNAKVATVNTNGTVTAVGPGTANITCTVKTADKNYSLVATITVDEMIPNLSSSATTMKLGGKQHTLSAKNTAPGSTFTWKSSNAKVASVSKKGVVKALKPGTATITCTVKTPYKTYTLKAKITVTGPKFAKSTASVKVGKNTQLKLNNKVTGATYTYKSSKPKIASVNKSGRVKGLKKGKSTISVKVTFPKKLNLAPLTLKTTVTVK